MYPVHAGEAAAHVCRSNGGQKGKHGAPHACQNPCLAARQQPIPMGSWHSVCKCAKMLPGSLWMCRLCEGSRESEAPSHRPLMIVRCMQGPAAAVGDKERGAGDWQLYQSPAAVLKEVAARNAQARLPGPPARPQARSFHCELVR